MTGDPLQEVTVAADNARARLDETRLAKAALVEALRRAREHGATLRQLAEASGLSHQRVSQLLAREYDESIG